MNLCDVDGVPFSLPGHFQDAAAAIAAADNCRWLVLDPLAGLSDVSLTAVATVRKVHHAPAAVRGPGLRRARCLWRIT